MVAVYARSLCGPYENRPASLSNSYAAVAHFLRPSFLRHRFGDDDSLRGRREKGGAHHALRCDAADYRHPRRSCRLDRGGQVEEAQVWAMISLRAGALPSVVNGRDQSHWSLMS